MAGIILSAVGTDFLVVDPGRTLDVGRAAVTLAGPVLYLFGELLFRIRMIRRGSVKRSVTIVVLVALGAISTSVPAAVLGLLVTAVLTTLAIWEYEPWMRGGHPPPTPALGVKSVD